MPHRLRRGLEHACPAASHVILQPGNGHWRALAPPVEQEKKRMERRQRKWMQTRRQAVSARVS